MQQARSRKEMLEEMQEDYSGFYQGVREVLKARENRLQGIEGAVAELLTVPKRIRSCNGNRSRCGDHGILLYKQRNMLVMRLHF